MKAERPTFSTKATSLRLALVILLVLATFGCKPKIGEDCATSTDCSIAGDRLCDVTQPSGYCTVFNCEPNQCPEEAACVAFSEGTCSAASVATRFRRTFCMRTCEEDSDCRSGGYRCLDLSRDPSRRVVDTNSGKSICALPSSSGAPPVPDPAVCFPSDASFDVSRPETGPRPPDAPPDTDGHEASVPDVAADRGDEDGPETGGGTDAATDAADSSLVETGTDASDDAVDETDSDDATSDAAQRPSPAAVSPP